MRQAIDDDAERNNQNFEEAVLPMQQRLKSSSRPLARFHRRVESHVAQNECTMSTATDVIQVRKFKMSCG